MDVTEVLLPGVGLRYEFTNHQGDRLGVVARRTGDFEVVVYKAEDPDAARTVLREEGDGGDLDVCRWPAPASDARPSRRAGSDAGSRTSPTSSSGRPPW